jgi:hypothetical protein
MFGHSAAAYFIYCAVQNDYAVFAGDEKNPDSTGIGFTKSFLPPEIDTPEGLAALTARLSREPLAPPVCHNCKQIMKIFYYTKEGRMQIVCPGKWIGKQEDVRGQRYWKAAECCPEAKWGYPAAAHLLISKYAREVKVKDFFD